MRARLSSYILPCRSHYFAISPLIGGSLAKPTERFPNVFGNSVFLKEYPYFLPCAVPATFSLVAWLVAFIFLKEVNSTF